MANSPIHADPVFRRSGRIMRAQAYANPNAICARCLLTLPEVRRTHPKATWDCGHRDDGDGFQLECSHCNRSVGAAKGNRNRGTNSLGL